MVKHIKAKVEANSPRQKLGKRSGFFLGMAGYYRKFCQNSYDMVSLLTNLLAQSVKYVWSEEAENGFNKNQSHTY